MPLYVETLVKEDWERTVERLHLRLEDFHKAFKVYQEEGFSHDKKQEHPELILREIMSTSVNLYTAFQRAED